MSEAGWGDPAKTAATVDRGLQGSSKGKIVVVGPNHEECNDRAIELLSFREDVYVIGNRLARDSGVAVGAMSRPNLGEILSACCDWRRRGKEGEMIPCHPPEWTVPEIHDRGRWTGLREVEGFSSVPLLRADGTVAVDEGYDSATRVILSSGHVEIPMSVEEAAAVLREAVCDFPFKTESHLSAWVCAALTPLAMYAFTGPMPLFLFEASTAGSGKTFLATIAGLIGTGGVPPLMSYRSDDSEMRKTITTHAMNPTPLVFMDNVEGVLGGAALNGWITSPDRVWSDRILGGNTGFRGVVNTAIYATANQTKIGADMERRVCPVRLTPDVARPEQRRGFRHSPLIPWVRANQNVLTWAALTLLRGPRAEGLEGWGSFEGWRDLVVGAVAAAGFGTPDAAVDELREHGGERTADGEAFVRGWAEVCQKHGPPIGGGLTVKEVYDLCYPTMGFGRAAEGAEGLRGVLEACFPKGVSTKTMGYLLRDMRDKVTDEGRLIQGGLVHGYRRWYVKR